MRIWFKRVASEIVFQRLHPETGASLHNEGVITNREAPPVRTSNSASEMPQQVCGHTGMLLLNVGSKSCQEVFPVENAPEKRCRLLLVWVSYSFSSEGVDHDALWPAVLNKAHQPSAHALNCLVSDCDEAERIETVGGQVCERVRLQGIRPDMTSNPSPRFSRTRTATRVTEATSVTSFGWTDVAKSAKSGMVKLVTEIVESTSGAIDSGMVSHTLPDASWWRAFEKKVG